VNWKASATTVEPAQATVADPESEPVVATAVEAAGEWLCAWCLNRVASDKDRFKFDGKDAFTFLNPEGIRFEIITFSTTLGCRQAGEPTLAHTWFPGHAWSFCLCDRCGRHLGWFYAGQHGFAGLISRRIVRAHCIRN
jgi:hypothetical protein